MSVPRMIVANFINFMAAARAWRIFLSNRWFGTRIVWDKTMHDFPSAAALARQRQRLGELLVAWKAIEPAALDRALGRQQDTGRPLGRILIAEEGLDEETVAEAVAFQADLPRAHPSADNVRRAAALMPVEFCLRWRMFPFGVDAQGRVKLATASPPGHDTCDTVTKVLNRGFIWFVVRESEVAAAMRLLRNPGASSVDLNDPVHAPLLLGDLLLDLNLVRRSALDQAVQQYRPDRHGRIGDFLVAQGVLTRTAIEAAVAAQARSIALQN